jgi:hypothetical protein
MSYYKMLNEIYAEKVASPQLQDAVSGSFNNRAMREEQFSLNSDFMWSADGQKALRKQNRRTEKLKNSGVLHDPKKDIIPQPESRSSFASYQAGKQKTVPPTQNTGATYSQATAPTVQPAVKANSQQATQSQNKNNTQAAAPAVQPAIKADPKSAAEAKANRASRTAAELAAEQQTKNNAAFKKALGYGTAAAAGIGLAAYGVHKIRQAKKERREAEAQQSQYPMQHTASCELNELYMEKLAAAEVPDASESIPRGVQDDASMIEKIQEAIKYTKKEDVPGGKSAPSKLVQRKNKERFKK